MTYYYYKKYSPHQHHLIGKNQVGDGGIPVVFRGPYSQQGHGLGSFFSGLFRMAAPLILKGAKAIGKQALKSGVQVIGDVATGHNFKQSTKRRMEEGIGNLSEKAQAKVREMVGSGRKRRKRMKSRQVKKHIKRQRKSTPAIRSKKRASKKSRRKTSPKKKKNTRKVFPNIFD
jgi:hypothetical protein